jgi:uncharacterized protein
MIELDRNGLAVLDRRECLRLAASQQLGRLSMTRQALPIIVPAAFGMVEDAPVFRVGSGAVRDASLQDAVCCFEVDASHPAWSWAWSVMMIGKVTTINDPTTIRRARQLDLPAWPSMSDGDTEFVRIEPEIVTGRSYSTAPAAGTDRQRVTATGFPVGVQDAGQGGSE